MAEAYVRQSAFSNGDVIDAPLFNAEFDQLVAAFGETSGHNHDGTPGAGAPVPFIEKGTAGVYVDTSNPSAHKIVFKLNGTVIREFTSVNQGTTSTIKHTPVSTGAPIDLDDYLESLEVAVGDASADAAQAVASAAEATLQADRAEAAAMNIGLPIVLADGASYTILPESVYVDLVCLGDATVTLPTSLAVGDRYSIRMSSLAAVGKLCTIVNPSYSIVGDVLTLTAGDNLQLKRTEVVILDAINTTTLEII